MEVNWVFECHFLLTFKSQSFIIDLSISYASETYRSQILRDTNADISPKVGYLADSFQLALSPQQFGLVIHNPPLGHRRNKYHSKQSWPAFHSTAVSLSLSLTGLGGKTLSFWQRNWPFLCCGLCLCMTERTL